MDAGIQPGSGDFLSVAARRRRNREEMVAAILEAAREVMREEGVAALNMHEVARRVGLRTQSLYYYFPSKAALYDALFLLGTRLLHERIEQVVHAPSDPWGKIQAAMETYIDFAQQHPELWKLVFERPVPGFVPSQESMEASRQTLRQGISVIADALESGQMVSGLTAASTTDFINAVMHGLTAAHMANEPELPPTEGRFGSLIPAAVTFFQKAWAPTTPAPPNDQPGEN